MLAGSLQRGVGYVHGSGCVIFFLRLIFLFFGLFEPVIQDAWRNNKAASTLFVFFLYFLYKSFGLFIY